MLQCIWDLASDRSRLRWHPVVCPRLPARATSSPLALRLSFVLLDSTARLHGFSCLDTTRGQLAQAVGTTYGLPAARGESSSSPEKPPRPTKSPFSKSSF